MSKRTFSARERFILRLTSFGRCKKCGTKLNKSFHADHVVPYSKGGETTLENAQALCPTCNLKKGAR
jgi:5-methylcytosine-specific restriction endonuclease McrA